MICDRDRWKFGGTRAKGKGGIKNKKVSVLYALVQTYCTFLWVSVNILTTFQVASDPIQLNINCPSFFFHTLFTIYCHCKNYLLQHSWNWFPFHHFWTAFNNSNVVKKNSFSFFDVHFETSSHENSKLISTLKCEDYWKIFSY